VELPIRGRKMWCHDASGSDAHTVHLKSDPEDSCDYKQTLSISSNIADYTCQNSQ
jgi:hypothetical protein